MWRLVVMTAVAATAFLAQSAAALTGGPKGVIALDEWTFDKVVDCSKTTLVKFDLQYPHGDHVEQWKQFAEEMAPMAGIVLAQVGVQEYGDKENLELQKRYGISSADHPNYLLFKQESSSCTDPNRLSGKSVTKGQLSRFLKVDGGVWVGLEGCIRVMDDIVKEFMPAEPQTRARLLQRAEAELEAGARDGGDGDERILLRFYVKVLRKILELGDEFVGQEELRIKRLLESKITSATKGIMRKRLNILSSFAIGVAPQAEQPSSEL